MRCEIRKCRAEPVQYVRRLWDGELILLCRSHAMVCDPETGEVVPRWDGLPAYRVEAGYGLREQPVVPPALRIEPDPALARAWADFIARCLSAAPTGDAA